MVTIQLTKYLPQRRRAHRGKNNKIKFNSHPIKFTKMFQEYATNVFG